MFEPTGISKKILTTSTLEKRFQEIGRAYIIDKRQPPFVAFEVCQKEIVSETVSRTVKI